MRLDDQCLQLYRVAHNMWKDNDIKLAEKYYQRIRVEHGCELYYEVVLPKNVNIGFCCAGSLGITNGSFFVPVLGVFMT